MFREKRLSALRAGLFNPPVKSAFPALEPIGVSGEIKQRFFRALCQKWRGSHFVASLRVVAMRAAVLRSVPVA